MAKAGAKKSALSGLIESDGEEDQLMAGLLSPDTSSASIIPTTKRRVNAKAAAKSSHAPSKVTKSKSPARRISGRLNKNTKATTKVGGKRAALADKTNLQAAEDAGSERDEDVDMDDTQMDELVAVTKKPAGKPVAKKTAPPTKVSKTTAKSKTKTTAAKAVSKAPAGKKGGVGKATASKEQTPETTIPETQVEVQEEETDQEEVDETRQEIIQKSPCDDSIPKDETELEDDATKLRRKLTELNKRFVKLNSQYEELQNVGVKQAEQIFDKFKKQSEERSKASDNLIASLKADLTQQSALAKDSKVIKSKAENQKLEMAALQVQVAELKASLSDAQAQTKSLMLENKTLASDQKTILAEKQSLATENKTLSSKLAANRSAAASVESVNTKVPGSAVKTNGGIRMVGTVEAAQLAQAAQLKEDIYSDLTGLIIQGVKREAEEDIFNCLQTGRNGTLHFKLAIANEKAAESYEDAQCSYVPLLDPSRDQVLLEVLPDYLVDEITFPRHQAAGFYARVFKALSEKIA